MTQSITVCPLCRETGSRPFDQRMFRGYPVTNRICTCCGFVFQSPRMTESELTGFYAAEYRRLYQCSEGPVAKDLAAQTQRAQSLLAFIRDNIPATASSGEDGQIQPDQLFLDIGCSTGKLMECFAQAFGCRVVGIEPGEAYRLDDQRRGLEVYASLEGVELSGQHPCDIISLIHVLEHLPDPVQYLAHLRQKLLQPAGWLLLEVPNLYAHDCFELAHLTSFSPHTLVQTLMQAGFETLALKKHGAPRSRLLPLYLTLLARPLSAPVQPAVSPEHDVARKRRIGTLRRRAVERLFPSLAWVPFP